MGAATSSRLPADRSTWQPLPASIGYRFRKDTAVESRVKSFPCLPTTRPDLKPGTAQATVDVQKLAGERGEVPWEKVLAVLAPRPLIIG